MLPKEGKKTTCGVQIWVELIMVGYPGDCNPGLRMSELQISITEGKGMRNFFGVHLMRPRERTADQLA